MEWLSKSENYLATFRDNFSSFYFKAQVVYLPLKMGRIACPETSVKNCHYTLSNIPEEGRSVVLSGGKQNSFTKCNLLLYRQMLSDRLNV